MKNVFMLSVVMLTVFMLCVIMIKVFMLNVFMLNVVAPVIQYRSRGANTVNLSSRLNVYYFDKEIEISLVFFTFSVGEDVVDVAAHFCLHFSTQKFKNIVLKNGHRPARHSTTFARREYREKMERWNQVGQGF